MFARRGDLPAGQRGGEASAPDACRKGLDLGGLETMKQACAHAIAGGYRFYSYGDACLLFRNKEP